MIGNEWKDWSRKAAWVALLATCHQILFFLVLYRHYETFSNWRLPGPKVMTDMILGIPVTAPAIYAGFRMGSSLWAQLGLSVLWLAVFYGTLMSMRFWPMG